MCVCGCGVWGGPEYDIINIYFVVIQLVVRYYHIRKKLNIQFSHLIFGVQIYNFALI